MPDPLPPVPPLLTATEAARILEAMERDENQIEVSLDLGLSTETVRLLPGGAELRDVIVPRETLRRTLRRPSVVFIATADGLEPLELRDQGYAKLVPTGGAPTIELSGVRMHRTAGINPFEDARLKVAEVVRSGDVVLDTCGGLGYTAIWARRLGARRVVSVEIDSVVLRLRRLNPWTLEHLEDDSTERLEGDVAVLIGDFPDGSFDTVLHDPPRFSLAGELYGSAFIAQLRRVLKPGGRLMFYTGEPYSRGRGRDFVAGVARRLSGAGFEAEWKRKILAFLARTVGGQHG